MAAQSSMDDCYFYYYSSCTKGDDCPFRHCQLALGTETVCSLWKEGRCFRSNCKFRHMESRINRATIPCYWENQPGGCRKPHCVFFHRKLRNGIQSAKPSQGLILPTVDEKVSPKLPDANEVSVVSHKSPTIESVPEKCMIEVCPSSVPVTPLVLSFDEESDTESVSSTPVKMSSSDMPYDSSGTARNNLSSKLSAKDEENDFGIKTLEQIRMEKIHKESDSFYGLAYEDMPLDAPLPVEQLYPPQSEFLALPKDPLLDKSLSASNKESQLNGLDEESDLRGRLSNRRKIPINKVSPPNRLMSFKKQDSKVEITDFLAAQKNALMDKALPVPNKEPRLGGLDEENDLRERLYSRRNIPSNKVNSPKRLLSFKKTNDKADESSSSLDFKIKTLDEIRKEKESKQNNKEMSDSTNKPTASFPSLISSSVEAKGLNGIAQKASKKLKITRGSKELYTVPAARSKDTAAIHLEEVAAAKTVVNGVQNMLEEQPLSSEMSSEEASVSPGKRKVELDPVEKPSKLRKIDTAASDDDLEISNVSGSELNSESGLVKNMQPFLRRPKISSFHSTSATNYDINDTDSSPTAPNCNQDDRSADVFESAADVIRDHTVNSISSTTAENGSKSSDSTKEEKSENVIDRSMSVDEFDQLSDDDDMNMDEIETTADDDILLEVEQFLDS